MRQRSRCTAAATAQVSHATLLRRSSSSPVEVLMVITSTAPSRSSECSALHTGLTLASMPSCATPIHLAHNRRP